jgi:hypothetical protein
MTNSGFMMHMTDKTWFYDAYEHAQTCKQHMAFNVPEE